MTVGPGVGARGAGAGAGAGAGQRGGRAEARSAARTEACRRRARWLAVWLALRQRLRATGQVAGRRRGSGRRPCSWKEVGLASADPRAMHRRGSPRTLPATMRPGPRGKGRGVGVKTDTCFLSKERIWAVGRLLLLAYAPWLLPWTQKVLDPLPFTGMC